MIRFDLLHQLWEMCTMIQADPAARAHFNLKDPFGGDAYDFELGKLITQHELFEHLSNNQNSQKYDCGTVGCVMGFGVLCIPNLRKYENIVSNWEHEEISSLLGLSYDEAANLFLSWKYPGGTFTSGEGVTPKMVADRIKKLIEEKT